MSQLFVSYSSKDRSKIKKLVGALEQKHPGWKIWWDKNIPAGAAFDREIGRALAQSKAIVVCWSTNSIDRDWVLDEALEGKERNILIPIALNKTEFPFGYRRIQAINFQRWSGGVGAQCFKQLEDALEEKLGTSLAKPKTPKPSAPSARRSKRKLSGGLDGKTIVFTGTLQQRRADHAEKVEMVGANFVNAGVTSNTDYLVVGKTPGAKKLADAKRHRTKKLSEKQWYRLLNRTYRRILEGRQIAFTGRLEEDRDMQFKKVKRLKAIPSESITKETTFLVVGKNPGAKKLADAKKYNLHVIEEKLWNEIVASLLPKRTFFIF